MVNRGNRPGPRALGGPHRARQSGHDPSRGACLELAAQPHTMEKAWSTPTFVGVPWPHAVLRGPSTG